jgi:hypothetical protein
MKLLIFPNKIICVFVVVIICSVTAFSQVKVGNNATLVNPNAVFELESGNKGFLLPRLALAATTSPYPLGAFVEGMMVYDTATVADIIPGIYYCDGTKWIRVSNGTSGNNTPDNVWSTLGNTATNPLKNFLGTTDANDMVFKTNGIERLRLTKSGWLGVGTSDPKAALHVKGQVIIDSVEAGNMGTDSLLVISAADGKVKAVNAGHLMSGVKRISRIVATTGQTIFTTPAIIHDADRISLYRNGILINFTVASSNSIAAEIACTAGDEIKIIQIL